MLLSLWECRTAIFRKSKLSLCSSDEQGFGKALVWKYGSIFERKESRNSSTFGVGEPLVSYFLQVKEEYQNCHLCLSQPVCSRRQKETQINFTTSGCEFGHWGEKNPKHLFIKQNKLEKEMSRS